jgi:hypothetical protein
LLFYKVGAYIVAYFPGNVKKKVKTNKQENKGRGRWGGKREPSYVGRFFGGVRAFKRGL